MTSVKEKRFVPDPAAHAVYNELYEIYRELHDEFGNVANTNLGRDEASARDRRRSRRLASTNMNLRETRAAPTSPSPTGLVFGTFGNLSIVDRAAGVFAIKPSGVPYGELKPDKIVLVSLESGAPIDSTCVHHRHADPSRALSCV